MCCFSRPVRHVSKTRIFARELGDERQLLVYGMSIDAEEDLAMVLPIPVVPRPREDAVRFVDLSSCPTFFDDVDLLFPEPVSGGFGLKSQSASRAAAPKLVVHEVGDFEASFVPARRDFDRLDERFRLPSGVWDALPGYSDWGFCVFKLKHTTKKPGLLDRVFGRSNEATERAVHPMAFEFPRRDPTAVFFPTVHVHDGEVHAHADFDHALYCQTKEPRPLADHEARRWRQSYERAHLVATRAQAWIDTTQYVHKLSLSGSLPNEDVIVAGAT